MEAPYELTGADAPVADGDAGEINGKEAAAVQDLSAGEDREAGRHSEDRIESPRQIDAIDDRHQEKAPDEAADQAEPHLGEEMLQGNQGDAMGALADQLHKGDCQEDCHGIVDP